MTDEIEAIEAALETEQSMMVRQRLFKQRWKLDQAAKNAVKDSQSKSSRTQGESRSKQNECNTA